MERVDRYQAFMDKVTITNSGYPSYDYDVFPRYKCRVVSISASNIVTKHSSVAVFLVSRTGRFAPMKIGQNHQFGYRDDTVDLPSNLVLNADVGLRVRYYSVAQSSVLKTTVVVEPMGEVVP